jgi:hypothetical protein
MDLRKIVRGPVSTVNPDVPVGWLRYLAYVTNDSGQSTATYAPLQTPMGQVQPLPAYRLTHMEQLNIQGVLRAVYLKGAVAQAVREDQTGGDLLLFPEVTGGPQRTWLVMLIDEQWPDWCRVVCQLQNDEHV